MIWGYGIQFLFTQGGMKFSRLNHNKRFFSGFFFSWGCLMNRTTLFLINGFPSPWREGQGKEGEAGRTQNRERGGEMPKVQLLLIKRLWVWQWHRIQMTMRNEVTCSRHGGLRAARTPLTPPRRTAISHHHLLQLWKWAQHSFRFPASLFPIKA